jgi:hypothetical protein
MKHIYRNSPKVILLQLENKNTDWSLSMDLCGLISKSLIIYRSFVKVITDKIQSTDKKSAIIKTLMKILGVSALRICVQVML